ncbi:hypothetical protein HRG84_14720 [Flavisolibacter sp. BT320]|nr:hypothetical protein [Flavisolibacter longurius]
MQTDKILKYYWDIFLSHTCEFYPLDKDFIEKYEYELDWAAISKNQSIAWDIDFLEKYETRFTWHELAWNESILWNEEKIDRFKKRLDWYYLGRNKNLPITEDFIVRYAKKLFVVEDNPLLTKSLIDKHKIRTLPKNTFDTQEVKRYNTNDFDKVFNKSTFHHNQKVIYEKVFLPIIKESSLERIFEKKFCNSQRYYFLEPIYSDVHGLTPEFEIKGFNPFNEFREGREPFAINNKLTLVNGSLQEGPDRLYEIPRFSSFSYYTTILVSENVRKVLDQYKLPSHIYHEVNLIPKKLTTTTQFYILQLAFDTLNKDLIYDHNAFYFSFKDFDNRGHGAVEEKINSQSELMAVEEKLKKIHSPIGYGVTIKPDRYKLKTDYDLYTYSVHGKIIINQYLKDILEKNFPGQILFKSAQLLNIEIEQSKYEEKKKLSINTKLSSKLSYRESDEDKFFYSKVERLENFDPPIKSAELNEDKFTKIELRLNVIFPEIFKNNYINKRIKIKGYSLLPISKFYLKNEYADRYPETYKSVVIAENGVGDSVNLILERDNDHKLQHRFFEFFHETGEYEEI